MRRALFATPFRIGLTALAVGLALGLVVLLVSVIPFGQRTYTVEFAQSANLKVAEDVQVSGVRVGEVRSVELEGNKVVVDFTVDRGIHLGQETTAAIKVMTLLGTHFLSVDPGGSGDLPDDTVPLSQTSVPFNLQDVIDQGTPKLEGLDTKRLAQMLTTMTEELSPSTEELGPALTGVVQVSEVIADRSDEIGALLASARSVTEQLSAGTGDLIALMEQTNLVVKEITSRRDAIHRLLVESTRLSRNLTGILEDTEADVRPALRSLNGALAELRRQDKVLREVLRTMAPAARYVANATGNGPYGLLNAPIPALPPNDAKCRLGRC